LTAGRWLTESMLASASLFEATASRQCTACRAAERSRIFAGSPACNLAAFSHATSVAKCPNFSAFAAVTSHSYCNRKKDSDAHIKENKRGLAVASGL
jgi:hypothetical protein